MNFKTFAAFVCAVVLMTSSLCFAAVDGGKISIGGIYPGMSATDLTDAFGQPTYSDGDDWQYQNFEIEIKGGVVEKVSTTSYNLTTPDGVRVGLAVEVLNTSFGTADKVDVKSDYTKYKYLSTDGTKKIEFEVAGGLIAKITCQIND